MALGSAAAGQGPCVLVLPHTHWDREWYHLAGRFRQRLVTLVDEVLEQPLPGVPSFLLDGQAVVLEDYLAVRPEQRHALAQALHDGRIEAGPWYVLADELIPSGEALVRNLLTGRGVVRQLGAAPPRVLYSPDAFGHPAALPQLAAGFGLPTIIAWRGFGGPASPSGDAFRWRAGDAEVLFWHLPAAGYEHGSELPPDDEAMRARWDRLAADLWPRARLGVLVIMAGADHHARSPDLAGAIAALSRAAAPMPVRAVSLDQLGAELEARARTTELPVITGELRSSGGHTWALQGTLAVRAAQKRRNARLERTLVREVEPWCALLARAGGADMGALVRAAWTSLLRCHPHDTLCGCSVDAVARAMDARLDDTQAQADGLLHDAMAALVGYRPDAARRCHGHGTSLCVVRNAAPRPRSGVAELEITTFRRHVPVGPGSRPEVEPERPAPRVSVPGVSGALQELARAVRHDRIESSLHYPDDDLVDDRRMLAWVDEVPAYGLVALPIRVHEEEHDTLSSSTLPAGVTPVTCTARSLDNGLVRVEVDDVGVVSIRSTRPGSPAVQVAFEDVGDAGDLYTHSPVGPVLCVDRAATVDVVHRGPLRGMLRTRWRLDIPAYTGRAARASECVQMELWLELSVDAGAPFARLRIAGENRARDHRLRLLFTSGIRAPRALADAAFAVLERPTSRPSAVDPQRREEQPVSTMPLARFVALFGDDRGLAVVSDGLAEGEVTDSGTVAVTLLRAVGELSRGDLPERWGHAGWPAATPEAQMLGPMAAQVSVAPACAWRAGTRHEIEMMVDDVLLPLRGVTLRDAAAVPAAVRGVRLTGRDLAFSACKQSEDGEWMVLRCVNRAAEQRAGAWSVPGVVNEARWARLDETPGDALASESPDHESSEIRFVAPPLATVTILVR